MPVGTTPWPSESAAAELPAVAERTMTVALERSVAADPGAIALRDRRSNLTYADAYRRALGLAGGLRELGVARSAHVLTMLENDADHVCLWLGLGLTGLVSVPINTGLKQHGLAHVINDSGAEVLVCDAEHLPAVAAVAADLHRLGVIVVRGEPQAPVELRLVDWEELAATEPIAPVKLDPWDRHSLMYTSGSTGNPKGVLVTHAQTYTRAAIVNQAVDDRRGVSLCTLPLFHVAGQCRGVYGPLIAGLESVVAPRFSVSGFWNDVRSFDVTSTLLLGTMASFLRKQPPCDGDRDHPLRKVVMAPLLPDVDRFEQRFGVRILPSYGSTEAGTVSTGVSVTGSSLGWLHPDFEACIVDADDVEVPPGEAGELLLRNRVPWTMTPGYWNRPQDTVDLWRNLWLHTGDIVRRRADGELVFVGRVKEIIRRRGENVSPADLEAAASAHPAVQDCVAFGVPADDGEEDIALAIVPEPGSAVGAEAVYAHMEELVARFMLPRYIDFYETLPRMPTEKPDKQALRRRESGLTWDRGW